MSILNISNKVRVLLQTSLTIVVPKSLINYLNIAAMLGLLATVALLLPHLLVEAFNPVTTNLPIIACSLILLSTRKAALSK